MPRSINRQINAIELTIHRISQKKPLALREQELVELVATLREAIVTLREMEPRE